MSNKTSTRLRSIKSILINKGFLAPAIFLKENIINPIEPIKSRIHHHPNPGNFKANECILVI